MVENLNKPRVLGVLAGGDLPLSRLAVWGESADVLLAADGAANSLAEIGLFSHTTVGDFDSIAPSTKEAQRELIQIDDPNATDCDKLLGLAWKRGYSSITLVGVEGDLLDHVIGNLYSSARAQITVRLALRRGVAHILRGPSTTEYQIPAETRISLLPLTSCSGVELIGTKWPLSDAVLDPLGLTSISNEGSGEIRARLATGVACLFLAHPELESPNWG